MIEPGFRFNVGKLDFVEVEIDFENFPDNLEYDALCNWLINNREDIWFVYDPREVFEEYEIIQNRNSKINNILND